MCENWAYDFDNYPFNFFFPKKKIFLQILYKFFQVLGLVSSCIFMECMGIPCCLFVVVKETPSSLHRDYILLS